MHAAGQGFDGHVAAITRHQRQGKKNDPNEKIAGQLFAEIRRPAKAIARDDLPENEQQHQAVADDNKTFEDIVQPVKQFGHAFLRDFTGNVDGCRRAGINGRMGPCGKLLQME